MRYHLIDSAAHMPSSCKGRYRRLAIVEALDPDYVPTQIREIKGRAHIITTWENLNVGKTEHCAYRRGLAEAQAKVAQMNEDWRERLRDAAEDLALGR